MTAREIIAMLREARGPVALVRGLDGGETAMLADLAEEGLEDCCRCVESSSIEDEDGDWLEIRPTSEDHAAAIDEIVQLLERAGELERDPENPRRVRFIEP